MVIGFEFCSCRIFILHICCQIEIAINSTKLVQHLQVLNDKLLTQEMSPHTNNSYFWGFIEALFCSLDI